MEIIIRPGGYSTKKFSAPPFKAHFNRSIPSTHNPNGTFFRTKEEYYNTLKKKGLEPYDPTTKDSGKRKAYKPSENLNKVITEIHNQTYRGKFKPSERLVNQMEAMGVKTKMNREDLKKLPGHYQKGGFYETKEIGGKKK